MKHINFNPPPTRNPQELCCSNVAWRLGGAFLGGWRMRCTDFTTHQQAPAAVLLPSRRLPVTLQHAVSFPLRFLGRKDICGAFVVKKKQITIVIPVLGVSFPCRAELFHSEESGTNLKQQRRGVDVCMCVCANDIKRVKRISG